MSLNELIRNETKSYLDIRVNKEQADSSISISDAIIAQPNTNKLYLNKNLSDTQSTIRMLFNETTDPPSNPFVEINNDVSGNMDLTCVGGSIRMNSPVVMPSENLNVSNGGNVNISTIIENSYVNSTGSGPNTGTLADSVSDGILKTIVNIGVTTYNLSINNSRALPNPVSLQPDNSISLIWSATLGAWLSYSGTDMINITAEYSGVVLTGTPIAAGVIRVRRVNGMVSLAFTDLALTVGSGTDSTIVLQPVGGGALLPLGYRPVNQVNLPIQARCSVIPCPIATVTVEITGVVTFYREGPNTNWLGMAASNGLYPSTITYPIF